MDKNVSKKKCFKYAKVCSRKGRIWIRFLQRSVKKLKKFKKKKLNMSLTYGFNPLICFSLILLALFSLYFYSQHFFFGQWSHYVDCLFIIVFRKWWILPSFSEKKYINDFIKIVWQMGKRTIKLVLISLTRSVSRWYNLIYVLTYTPGIWIYFFLL